MKESASPFCAELLRPDADLAVFALLGSVLTAGLLAWNAVEATSSATHFRTVLTMSSSDPRGAGGSMVSSPFLTYNEVRVLLSTPHGGSPAHLSGLIVALNQANASGPPTSGPPGGGAPVGATPQQ